MSKVKKFVVLKYDYEYNDNWYEHNENISETEIKVFDKKDVAEKHKKDLTKKAIGEFPTENNLSNIQDNVPNLSEIRNLINSNTEDEDYDEDDYETRIPSHFLEGEKWDKLYPMIADTFYKIVEVEVDADATSITLNWKSDYAEKTYIGIVENNDFLLHSAKKPAVVEKDDWEVYKSFYLKGKKYEKESEWKSESRKYKIGNLLTENEKEE